MGRAVAQPRQRGRRAARADRRLARHRPDGPGRRDRRLVGRRRRTRRADRHRPLVCDRHQRARRLPRVDRSEFARPGRKAVGLKVSRWSRCATRSRPTSPRWRRWASPRSPRWSAARWAAPGRWSGSSAIPTRCARRWCWRSAPARPPTRSARRARRSRRSSPIRTGRTATTTAPAAAPDVGMEIARRFAHLTYRGEAELDDRFANDPQGDEDPVDRRPLLGAELPRVPGPQAVGPVRRGHLRRADRCAVQPRRRPRPRWRGGRAAQLPGARGGRRHHLGPAVSAAAAGGTGRTAAGLHRNSTWSTRSTATTGSWSRPRRSAS